ncbi:senescence/dehydration-associated protein At4g35985, chloroplastic-like isoform X2 [Durio zibethinus]|uniref:Senescence/dehydration-associated protein At4g35985, chloroplastic-like isoform X2 n=1 Tax=Durio zibethinus TaxID=66656 RepID=A0A6P5XRV3_DURZI|nr:senescence/dehydration-associated protein At4g35985, chloroplastic-like isoform X2 [Durio zibethinus]
MGCFRPKSSKTSAPMQPSSTEPVLAYPENRNLKLEVLLQIPGCTVHLMDEGEALELARGEFTLVRILDADVPLATIVKVGEELQWPLTKDEPVVKLDSFHYLFSLPMKDGNPLSYGVTFSGQYGSNLGSLDSFLKEHSCFSGAASTGDKHVNWKEYAPRIEDYNNVLAKAIAGGTGQIVKGIFKCSNAYTSQVQKGGEIILTPASNGYKSSGAPRKSSGANKSLKRVRKLSKMTEKLSKSMLDVVGVASGTVMAPLVNSKPGKAFLSMVPGEVLVASLDATRFWMQLKLLKSKLFLQHPLQQPE